MKKTQKQILVASVFILLALFSIFVVAKHTTSVEFHADTIQTLDDKKITVIELTTAATATSAAITLIPGDACIPIAEKLADFSTYFLVVLAAIYLEKFLLTITGYASFVIIIPLAFVLCAVNVFVQNKIFTKLAGKALLFGLALFLIVPVSVTVSDMIETTYNASIEQTVEAAKNTVTEIEGAEESTEEKGFWEGIVSGIENSISAATTQLEHVLTNFIEALAVMLITSCVIPVGVLLFFVWLVKFFLSADFAGEIKKLIA